MSDFLSLDSLLDESMALKAQTSELKSARTALKSGLVSGAERKELEADILRLELAREWLPAADVAMFSRQVCDCGSTSSLFQGIFQRQTHRNMRASARWIKSTAVANMGLQKEIKTEDSHVTHCSVCIGEAGYPTAGL